DLVVLTGGLGAGKTHFVKALAESYGALDPVASPTYTIAHFYRTQREQILHIDAYRLETIEAFRDLVLDEYFPDVITLMEWGQLAATDFEDYLTLNIQVDTAGEVARTFTLTPTGSRWTSVWPQLTDQLKTLDA
ncbi:MAG: tRNA (adenosine(37)-N6)-threonylcarbamoyltransferase complex ATPase subunit type 1 TsaE, partial [Bacteroidota bacterium]